MTNSSFSFSMMIFLSIAIFLWDNDWKYVLSFINYEKLILISFSAIPFKCRVILISQQPPPLQLHLHLHPPHNKQPEAYSEPLHSVPQWRIPCHSFNPSSVRCHTYKAVHFSLFPTTCTNDVKNVI